MNKIVLILSIVLMLAACSSAPQKRQIPVVKLSLPDEGLTKVYKPTNINVPFNPPSKLKENIFVAKNGKDSITTDKVTVKVDSIISELKDNSYSVDILGPDGVTYKYGLFPMMVVLKISNGTDHIVTLDKTIVKIEDETQNDFPMISNVAENKQNMISRVNKAFDSYAKKMKSMVEDDFKKQIGNVYTTNYEAMVAKINEYESYGYRVDIGDICNVFGTERAPKNTEMFREIQGYNRVQRVDMLCAVNDDYEGYLNETGIKQVKALLSSDKYLPYYNKHFVADANIDAQVNIKIKETNALKADAVSKVDSSLSTSSIKNLILSSGVFQPIVVLPGRTEKVIIPFNKRNEDEDIKSVNLFVFDLPTQVDAAGTPTKRANFQFEMIAVDAK